MEPQASRPAGPARSGDPGWPGSQADRADRAGFELDAEAQADSRMSGRPGVRTGNTWPSRGRAHPRDPDHQGRFAGLLQMLDHALLPAWSPDGSKLAFIHVMTRTPSLQVVERRGQIVHRPRAILPIGGIAAPVLERRRSIDRRRGRADGARSRSWSSLRIVLETGESSRILSLAPEVLRRGAAIRGVAIDFDRDDERCFFAVDFEGRDTEVCWSFPRDQHCTSGFIRSIGPCASGAWRSRRTGVPWRCGSERRRASHRRPSTTWSRPDAAVRRPAGHSGRGRPTGLARRPGRTARSCCHRLPPVVVEGSPSAAPPSCPCPARSRPPPLARSGSLGSADSDPRPCRPPAAETAATAGEPGPSRPHRRIASSSTISGATSRPRRSRGAGAPAHLARSPARVAELAGPDPLVAGRDRPVPGRSSTTCSRRGARSIASRRRRWVGPSRRSPIRVHLGSLSRGADRPALAPPGPPPSDPGGPQRFARNPFAPSDRRPTTSSEVGVGRSPGSPRSVRAQPIRPGRSLELQRQSDPRAAPADPPPPLPRPIEVRDRTRRPPQSERSGQPARGPPVLTGR